MRHILCSLVLLTFAWVAQAQEQVRFEVTGEIVPGTCIITTPKSVPVDLGSYSYATVEPMPVGQTFGHTSKQMILNCAQNSYPIMTLSDTKTINNLTNVVQLDKSASVARGVGVQVFYNNNPNYSPNQALKMEEKIPLVNQPISQNNTSITVDLVFAFVRIYEQLVIGPAKAMVTATFTY